MSGAFSVVLFLAVIILIYKSIRHSHLRMPAEKGKAGEREIKRKLALLPNSEYIVLNDVLLPTKNGTTQLDHIVVSLYGIFVIETKNYAGKIYGGKNSEQWTQYIGKETHVFRNPLKQNFGHMLAVA